MKKIIISGAQVVLTLALTGSMVYAMQPNTEVEKSSEVQAQAIVKEESPKIDKVEQETPQPAPEKVVTWQDNPNNCNTDTQYISEDAPFNCIDKPQPAAVATNVVPVGVHDLGGTGSCAEEIVKYKWPQSVAIAVASAESGMRPGVVNNNPSTGDYSIGCFQVNIYGGNAASRPSQEQLMNAKVNVEWAYNNYVANGHSFIGQWGVCRSKVQCI